MLYILPRHLDRGRSIKLETKTGRSRYLIGQCPMMSIIFSAVYRTMRPQ